MLVHTWPGNVRELRNVIERAVILCNGGPVSRQHLPVAIARPAATASVAAPEVDFPAAGVSLDSVERELGQKALARAKDNKSQTARLLGVTRGQLYSMMRRHGLTDARR